MTVFCFSTLSSQPKTWVLVILKKERLWQFQWLLRPFSLGKEKRVKGLRSRSSVRTTSRSLGTVPPPVTRKLRNRSSRAFCDRFSLQSRNTDDILCIFKIDHKLYLFKNLKWPLKLLHLISLLCLCMWVFLPHTQMAIKGHGSQSSNSGVLESSSPSEPSCQPPR